jgi:molybdate transport system permease protein
MDLSPIWLTFKLAAITTLILLIIGLAIGYWLGKGQSLGKLLIEALLTLPLFLPPSVLGFYLLLAFSPRHGLGKWLLEHIHIQFVFSFEGLVLASVIYNLPFMIGPIKSGIRSLPLSLSQASHTLGKSKWETFLRVLLPNAWGSVITGIVQTFAHTLGEFGVVLMIGGNIPGLTRVASIAIYDSVENMDYGLANRYSLILFGITFSLVILIFLFNQKNVKSPLE